MKGVVRKSRFMTVAWTPSYTKEGLRKDAESGDIAVIERHGDSELQHQLRGADLDRYVFTSDEIETGGACSREEFSRRKLHLFILAAHLMVRDRIAPSRVHEALLAFEEYVDGCADDMPNVRGLR